MIQNLVQAEKGIDTRPQQSRPSCQLPSSSSTQRRRSLTTLQAAATDTVSLQDNHRFGPRRAKQVKQQPLALHPTQRKDIMDVRVIDDRIVSQDGTVIMQNVTDLAFVDNAASTPQALVLGFEHSLEDTSSKEINIGQVLCQRFVASARNKLWWMTPAWGSTTHQLPPETQFILMEIKEGGPYVVMLPLISQSFRSTLRPPVRKNRKTKQDLHIRIESGIDSTSSSRWPGALLVQSGFDPYALLDAAIITAASLSGTAQPLTQKRLPDFINMFGWCTWDAFYTNVSARGVVSGVTALSDAGVPPGFVIIDDGWQLTDVDAAYSATPATTLAHAVSQSLRADHPGYARVVSDKLHQLGDGLSELNEYLQSAQGSFNKLYNAVMKEMAVEFKGSSELDTVMPTICGSLTSVDEASRDNGCREWVGLKALHVIEREVMEIQSVTQARGSATLLQLITGAGIALLQAAFMQIYHYIVEPAPPFSWPVRFFTYIANGPLRVLMLQFYAKASHFTRRVISVQANGKFSDPSMGPEAESVVKEGFGSVVSHLKKELGVKSVLCWHGLAGYWAGVMPDMPTTSKYGAEVYYPVPPDSLLEIEPSLGWNPCVSAGVGGVAKPQELFNDMHDYLSKSGVDGVKVDCQAGVSFVGTAYEGSSKLASIYHSALEQSIRNHFPNNAMINCMCHSTDNMYNFTDTAIARASDDFYPRDPASSAPHIAACTYNSLFMSPLVQLDWDMFHSHHPAAEMHAIARAVSGGPVYVSDKPGKHDTELLRKLVCSDCSILRCKLAARPTRDSLFIDVQHDGKSACKVWNHNAFGGVIGVFNLQGSAWDRKTRQFRMHSKVELEISVDVCPDDVEQWSRITSQLPGHHDGSFAVWNSSSTEKHVRLARGTDTVTLDVRKGKAAVVTIAPVCEYGEVRFAPLGLENMYNSGGAIEALSVGNVSRNGSGQQLQWSMQVRGSGKFVAFCSTAEAEVVVDGVEVITEYDVESGTLAWEVVERGAHGVVHDVEVSVLTAGKGNGVVKGNIVAAQPQAVSKQQKARVD